jgi:hypothetical protein
MSKMGDDPISNTTSEETKDEEPNPKETLSRKIADYEKFHRIFTDFLKEAEVKFKEMGKRVADVTKDTNDLIILFGEDENTKSTDFFALFFNFARDFCNCYKNMLLSEKVKQE